MERQASAGLRVPACLGPIACPGPRTAFCGATAGRAHPARASPGLDGLTTSLLTTTEKSRLVDLVARRLAVVQDSMLVLTRDGRLLADGVIRDLLE